MNHDSLGRRILLYAAIAGALGVTLGAFGAHGLDTLMEGRGYEPSLIAKRLGQYDVAVQYHLIHAVALLALASLSLGSTRTRQWVAWLFVAGLWLFSGSLYLLVLTNTPKWGMVTPIGGLCWIFAWLLLIRLAFQPSNEGSSLGESSCDATQSNE